MVEQYSFSLIEVGSDGGQVRRLDKEESEEIWRYLVTQGYLDQQGKITDQLRESLLDRSFSLQDEFEPLREAITAVLRKAAGRIDIKEARARRIAQPREAVLDSEEFKTLWERINHKTTYRLKFDNESLLKECATALGKAPLIPRPRLRWEKAEIQVEPSGVHRELREQSAPMYLVGEVSELPDLLTELQDRTQLTRRSIVRILLDSGRLNDFLDNPQKFIEIAAEAINCCKQSALVDGIKYQRLGDDVHYAQELFVKEELTGYLDKMLKSQKSVYDHVIWDSVNERKFAEHLEMNTAVKVFAKLPWWFKVPTPLGDYNPDWAVLVTCAEGERLYFVAETKGSTSPGSLREREYAKVKCGEAHFKALAVGNNPVEFRIVQTVDQLFD